MYIDIIIPPDIAEQISNTNVSIVSYKIGVDLFAGQIRATATDSKLVNVTAKGTSSEDVQEILQALVRTTRDFVASSKWDGGHLHIVIDNQKTSVADAMDLKTNCLEISVAEAMKLSGAITSKNDKQT